MKEFLALFCSNCTACGGNGAISSPENWWSVRKKSSPEEEKISSQKIGGRWELLTHQGLIKNCMNMFVLDFSGIFHCQLHIELLMLQKKFASARKLCFSEIKKACLTYILPDTGVTKKKTNCVFFWKPPLIMAEWVITDASASKKTTWLQFTAIVAN